MSKVVVLVDEGCDSDAWYLNGQYVGHDDQITALDVMGWLGGEIREADLSYGCPDSL